MADLPKKALTTFVYDRDNGHAPKYHGEHGLDLMLHYGRVDGGKCTPSSQTNIQGQQQTRRPGMF